MPDEGETGLKPGIPISMSMLVMTIVLAAATIFVLAVAKAFS